MDLNIIYKNKEDYYNLANDYFSQLDSDKLEINDLSIIFPKSIAILIDNDFISTPCIEIKLNILQNQKEVGDYFLYINEEKEFIDEFLVMY